MEKEETIKLQLLDSASPHKTTENQATSDEAVENIKIESAANAENSTNNAVNNSETLRSYSAVNTDEDDYDPHEHRDIKNKTSNVATLIHLLKGSLGTGILAMPNAFGNSGLLVGVIATVIIGALCTYCLHVFIKAQYKLCKQLRRGTLTYPETMAHALNQGPKCTERFSKYAPLLIDGFLVMYQLGICCVYIVFITTNLQQVIDLYCGEWELWKYTLSLSIAFVVINYIPNLKKLTPFSAVANVLTFVGLVLTLTYMAQDLPPISDREMFGTLRNFALYFGTTLFALEAIGLIIALENKMKTPKDFLGYCGVLNIGMTVIVFLYILIGFFGYMKYGVDAEGSVTFNLPSDEIMAQSVKILFAIAIFFTYALQAYVPIEILWDGYLKEKAERWQVKETQKRTMKCLAEYGLRTALVISTVILAVSIPRLGLFISLFGAFCLSALGISFPGFIDICVLWPNKDFGPFKYRLLKNIFLIVFGMVGLVVGTYVSIVDIIISFK